MGDTFRGTAIPLTEQRTDRMIMILSLGIVFTLAVGGFVMAVNYEGGQNLDSVDDVADEQIMTVDGFDLAETAQPREFDFVLESESGCWGPLCTEQGAIYIEYSSLPDLLPLCIDNTYLQQWYVDIIVVGGYKPWGGYIDVWQKGDYKGTIDITWTYMGPDAARCCGDYWQATFSTVGPICLESTQYPDVTPFDITNPDGLQTIPGKCVTFEFYTDWTGCVPGDDPSQDFTIIQTQSFETFSERLILTLYEIRHLPNLVSRSQQ